mmetsp:Transcript_10090/g.18163  ORF Transcript_10090/g.18163 Transcript_10090/m.18163 type:complete len:782 (-) Transcript_10090:237-2582(-)
MTKFHSAIAVATVALSPSCSTALSILPRQQQQPRKISGAGNGGLFGKRSSRSSSTQQWMLPSSFQPTKFLLSRLQATKEKDELFFTAANEDDEDDDGDETEEKSWPINPTPPSEPPIKPTPPPEPPQPTFVTPPKPVISNPSPPEQSIVDILKKLSPLLNPTIAKNVPPNMIQGAAINGAFLTLLTSFFLFGPFSVTSFTTLIAAASVGLITAYISITEGSAGDFVRGIGRVTMQVTDGVLGEVEPRLERLKREREVEKVANALLVKPTKQPKKIWESSVGLSEGLTAEEAEEVRNARLTGEAGASSTAEVVEAQVTEGQTAEEAESSRNARLDAADEAAKSLKPNVPALTSVDYDAAARLAYNASGADGDFEVFRDGYLVKMSAMIAQKHQDKILAEKEEVSARIVEEEKVRAAAEMKAAVEAEDAAAAEKKRQAEEAGEKAIARAAVERKADAEEAAAADKKRARAEEDARAKAAAKEEAKAKAAEEEEALTKAAAEKAQLEAEAQKQEEARLAELAAAVAEEQRMIEEQAEVEREMVRHMQERAQKQEEARLAEMEAAVAREEEERQLEEQAKAASEALAEMAAVVAEEQRQLEEEQTTAAREAVRLMEEQEALVNDEEEDELDDDDWEASIRLANELEGVASPPIGGDIMDDIGDDMLQMEIDDLSPDEENALGKAAREAVRKYEEEMAMKSRRKEGMRSSWEEGMVQESAMVTPTPPPAAEVKEEPINGGEVEEAAAPASVDYSKMTVAQLKDELRSKGLKVGGKKAELVERLETL